MPAVVDFSVTAHVIGSRTNKVADGASCSSAAVAGDGCDRAATDTVPVLTRVFDARQDTRRMSVGATSITSRIASSGIPSTYDTFTRTSGRIAESWRLLAGS